MNQEKESALDKEEESVFNEFLQEAEEETKQPAKTGKREGIIGIVIGAIGFFMPFFLLRVFAGIAAAGLAIYANKHGSRRLAIPAAILALLDLAGFFLFNLGQVF